VFGFHERFGFRFKREVGVVLHRVLLTGRAAGFK
jgi:hypothetical protein